jgi:mRNA interferase RelE/StbE
LYEILFRRRAEKDSARLSGNVYQRLARAIDRLADDPRPPGCTRLKGR